MTDRLFIFGAGGHGRELAWLAREAHGPVLDIVFLVDDPRYLVGPVDDIDVRLVEDVEESGEFVLGVGDAALRRRAATALGARGLRPATLVHPRAEHSARVQFGAGSVVCAGAVLTTNIVLGCHAHVNVGCTVSHDVTIGDFVTLSPGVHVSGHVVIEDDVFIGVGASVIDGKPGRPLVIGTGAMVAAGATVIGSVEAGVVVAGVPAVQKRYV